MVIWPRDSRYLVCPVLMLFVGCGMFTGCATLPANHTADLSQAVKTDANVRGEVVVQLKDDKGSRYLKAPLRGNMVVQDALTGSGALNEFNRMDVVVVRTLPSGEKLRMPVTVDPGSRAVNSATDYSLYPGDVVEVTEDPRTLLDRVIDSALSSLGPIATHQRR